jgi:hypothetical protein
MRQWILAIPGASGRRTSGPDMGTCVLAGALRRLVGRTARRQHYIQPETMTSPILRRHTVVTFRSALQCTFVAATLSLAAPADAQDPALQPPPAQQCAANVAATCPARREIIAVGGWAEESPSVGVSWTTVRRFGAYIRLFPGLEPKPGSAPDTTIRAESLREFGASYRLTGAITIGVGWGQYVRTDTEYGAIDPLGGRPVLIDKDRVSESGPSLFLAYAFHKPSRAIGLAASASLGVVGSGVAIGTTLRFPRVRAPIGE